MGCFTFTWLALCSAHMTGKYLARNCFVQIEVLFLHSSRGTMKSCDKTSVKLIGVSLHIQTGLSTNASPEHCWQINVPITNNCLTINII